MGSSLVQLKTRRVGELCTLNLSTAQTSSRWSGVVVRKLAASSGVVFVTFPCFKIARSVAKSPRVSKECDVNSHSLATATIPVLCPKVVSASAHFVTNHMLVIIIVFKTAAMIERFNQRKSTLGGWFHTLCCNSHAPISAFEK
ncbi:hypothetical protein TNCV_877401 [Trichonephila clavipes]|nr:hypothetical protein TNCV_877401 [Trichonephila clavipes]